MSVVVPGIAPSALPGGAIATDGSVGWTPALTKKAAFRFPEIAASRRPRKKNEVRKRADVGVLGVAVRANKVSTRRLAVEDDPGAEAADASTTIFGADPPASEEGASCHGLIPTAYCAELRESGDASSDALAYCDAFDACCESHATAEEVATCVGNPTLVCYKFDRFADDEYIATQCCGLDTMCSAYSDDPYYAKMCAAITPVMTPCCETYSGKSAAEFYDKFIECGEGVWPPATDTLAPGPGDEAATLANETSEATLFEELETPANEASAPGLAVVDAEAVNDTLAPPQNEDPVPSRIETSVNETSAKEISTNETSTKETSAKETLANKTSANETSVSETSANETSVIETSANETSAPAPPVTADANSSTVTVASTPSETDANDGSVNHLAWYCLAGFATMVISIRLG